MDEINLYRKQFRQDIKFFINKLKYNEIVFYGFTINFFNYIDNKEFLLNNIENEINNLISILKKIDLIEFVYITREVHNKFNRHDLLNIKSNKLKLNIKNNMEGLVHLHGVFGIRSILKNNKSLNLNIIEYLRNYYNDIKINELLTEKDILNYWNYCIKENTFENHNFIFFSKFYESLYGLFSDRLNYFYENNIDCLKMKYIKGKHDDIKGIPVLKNNSNNTIILYFIALYLNLKNYKINNKNIYKKNNSFKYSWDFIDTFEIFIKKNMVFIYKELCNYFSFHLEFNDSIELLINSTLSSISVILEDLQLLPQFEIYDYIIEFTDGLYFTNNDYFFCYKENINLNNENINCIKYYNKSYKNLKRTGPKYWLSLLSQNFKNKLELLDFCTNLGYYFNCNVNISQDIKKKTLVIVGPSNSGKTLLITNPIIAAHNPDKIGLISDISDNFIFENIENKNIIIADEFKFIKNTRSTLLKLLNNELILINKKNKSKISFKNKAPVLFIFNESQNLTFLNDSAFINRLLIYTFTVTIKEKNALLLKKKLAQEIPAILIYCNHLFFKKYGSTDIKKQSRKYYRNLLKNKTVNENIKLLN